MFEALILALNQIEIQGEWHLIMSLAWNQTNPPCSLLHLSVTWLKVYTRRSSAESSLTKDELPISNVTCHVKQRVPSIGATEISGFLVT